MKKKDNDLAGRAAFQLEPKDDPLETILKIGVWGLVPNAICKDAKPRREKNWPARASHVSGF